MKLHLPSSYDAAQTHRSRGRKRRGLASWRASASAIAARFWHLLQPGWLLLPLAFAVVLAGITHIVSILLMPTVAERGAYARLSGLAGQNEMVLLADPTPQHMALPMMDPAFITAICLFDIASQPLKVQVPATSDYVSVSFYTDKGLAFYALTDKAAARAPELAAPPDAVREEEEIELDLMTAEQKAVLPEDETITAADRLIIVAPVPRGIIAVRAFVSSPSLHGQIRHMLERASCTPSPRSMAPSTDLAPAD
ncbi:DUF1254 domain-containing protein [Xanthobacter sp. TB0139]|uniref:DUF1254 domain-containing protein n=1 Tax=Xanthobacter sp. TB0139 TaxID=3459178 RepID=UPI004039F94E